MTRSSDIKNDFKKIGRLISNFYGLWIIHIGRTTRILHCLGVQEQPVSEAFLVKKLNATPEFIKVWLQAALSFELIEYKPKKGFYLLPTIKSILIDKKNKYYMGATADLCMELMKFYKDFPKDLKNNNKTSRGPHLKASKIMADISCSDFQNILSNVINKTPELKNILNSGGSILDLGVGLGRGPVFFAEQFPECKITGVDIDQNLIKKAEKRIARTRFRKNIQLLDKGIKKIVLRNKFDFIYMNLSLHEICSCQEEMVRTLKKCKTLLKKHGFLFISEHPFLDDIRKQKNPVHKMILGLQLAEAVFGSKITTVKEYRSIIKKAGFSSSSLIKQPNPARVFFLIKNN